MDGLLELIQAIGQTGLPVALIGWAIWFVTVKVWPWYASESRRELDRAVEIGKSNALTALADAIKKLTDVIGNGPGG